MVKYCCVPGCKHNVHTIGISFHQFPKDERKRKLWIRKVWQEEKPNCPASSSIHICSSHFLPSDYKVIIKGTNKCLKREAVPSIFSLRPTSIRKIKCKRTFREFQDLPITTSNMNLSRQSDVASECGGGLFNTEVHSLLPTVKQEKNPIEFLECKIEPVDIFHEYERLEPQTDSGTTTDNSIVSTVIQEPDAGTGIEFHTVKIEPDKELADELLPEANSVTVDPLLLPLKTEENIVLVIYHDAGTEENNRKRRNPEADKVFPTASSLTVNPLLLPLKTEEDVGLVNNHDTGTEGNNQNRQNPEAHSSSRIQGKGGRPSLGDNPPRLTERHFCSLVPPTACKPSPQRQCFVCMHTCRREKKRKDTRYQCRFCDKGLCVSECFEDYHTMLNF